MVRLVGYIPPKFNMEPWTCYSRDYFHYLGQLLGSIIDFGGVTRLFTWAGEPLKDISTSILGSEFGQMETKEQFYKSTTNQKVIQKLLSYLVDDL